MESSRAQLIVYQPDLPPAHFPLTSQLVTLGRASDCSVPIKDRFLSRLHAEIAHLGGDWIVRDCGSSNGTLLNGARITAPIVLRSGDRIALGDTEVVFEMAAEESQLVAVDSSSAAKNMTIRLEDAIDEQARGKERDGVLASLAVQFIEDRSMSELFEFILDRVVELLEPSRAAIALLGPDGRSFTNVRLRRTNRSDSADLMISRTLLEEVIEERSVVSFVDTAEDERLARAESIIGQGIRSVVCAPLLVGDEVLGVLYLDFQAWRGAVARDDVRLVAQIARFAAAKLETTRLREEKIAKERLDEELRTAYTIQSRLLPAALPTVDGYVFAGTNRPCRTVSGDYYDIVVRPDGRIWFVVADVSGKGITAALVMASLATAFGIFTQRDPTPAELVRDLNLTLVPKTAPTKFATLFAGRLDPRTGVVEFANAGHVPPLVVSSSGVNVLSTTDMVVGLFASATYRDQQVSLAPGDSLVLFTDGVTEAENAEEEQLGLDPVAALLGTMHGIPAHRLLESIDAEVARFAGEVPPGDDVTMLAVTRVA